MNRDKVLALSQRSAIAAFFSGILFGLGLFYLAIPVLFICWRYDSKLQDRDTPWGAFRARFIAYSKSAKAKGSTTRELTAISAYERIEKPAMLSDVTSESLERFKGVRRPQKCPKLGQP